jgi:hypothetical protein
VSDSDAVDAFVHHVIGEASGCGEHTSCTNGCDDSTDHGGPSSAEVASCEACKSSAESYEKGCHSDDGLLRCGERTFLGHEACDRIMDSSANAKGVVVGRHQEDDSTVAWVDVLV